MRWFAVRVGARRLADAAHWIGQIDLADAAIIAGAQAWLVGALQYPLVIRDDATLAKTMRDLAPTYDQLCDALAAETVRRVMGPGCRAGMPFLAAQSVPECDASG